MIVLEEPMKETKDMKMFSVRLREAMNNKGMKQSELANKTKIDKSQIHHYLKGTYEPKTENIQLIADALDVSVTWLLGYDIPSRDEIEATSNAIKSGKYSVPPIERSGLEDIEPDEKCESFWNDLSDEAMELITIYQSLGEDGKKQLLSFAKYMESSNQ